jgi:gamma-glutamyltranspeptidase/glutathione hydrolase
MIIERGISGFGGAVTAPHHLAARAGGRVLSDGGNAIEAMIAAAACIAVVYPHMNGLGGDNVWLIHSGRGSQPVGFDACGAAAGLADAQWYRASGYEHMPSRGPKAASTVAGAVSGWGKAYEWSSRHCGGKLPLTRLFEDAIYYAKAGFSVTDTLARNARLKRSELESVEGYSNLFMPSGSTLRPGERFCQPQLALTLERLAARGFDDFYTGELAHDIAEDLERMGSPLRGTDLNRHQSIQVDPLQLSLGETVLFNMPPPTQGISSLMLLGIFSRLRVEYADRFEYIHGLLESTKRAFIYRDRYLTDPEHMTIHPRQLLSDAFLDRNAASVNWDQAAPWPAKPDGGDTVWLGSADSQGRVVSFIQSLYWEFGSGVVLPQTGITWQNRGSSFSLDSGHHNCLKPFRRPFHTIQPALAHLSDGRVVAYGTMGGDGQPQTQAMILSRYAGYGQGIQQAINAPRWLLGRTWGSEVTNVRIENRFPVEVFDRLLSVGHELEVIGPYDDLMGHAGAIVLHPDGLIEGASDPRSDGSVVVV